MHQQAKKLPIEHLGGIVRANRKTISRSELEERIIAAVPDIFRSRQSRPDHRDIALTAARGQEHASLESARLRSEITARETDSGHR